ncbi:oligosaccharide repeat unit polymerase [Brenneria izadpanahii]|uniref:Oligosaccharide repeat unit polymerase n=1 Tax=Brenneria izadpanahii TaxID=2722756 RepID=A0ABX7UU92_9GAMM|nr:O-antigen polymerase [Brenneria izadpanahii]QTF09266.1 oligosaccharide repeat unit polymerase [Brenneria izadpanahii]
MKVEISFRNSSRFFISPAFAAIVSYFIFLISLTFPPNYYSKLISEKNYIFFDPASFILVTVSLIFFFLGMLVTKKRKNDRLIVTEYNYHISNFKYIAIPVILSIIFSIMSIRLLLDKNPFILAYLLIGDGANIKRELDLSNTMAQAAQFSICIALWATVNYNNVKHEMNRMPKFILVILITFLSIICISNASLKMARFEIIPLLLGMMVVFINQRYKTVSNVKVIKYMVISFISIVALFGLFSFMRGFDSSDDVIRSIIGYTVTSYNHMAALLDGTLEYLYPGHGYYIATFLSYIPLIGDSFTYSILGWPHPEDVRYREFMDTYEGMLNGNYIWITVFGYVWISIKILTPLFMFFYGVISQLAWNSFRLNKLFGLIFYPWLFFCIIFWLGSNILIQQPTISVFFSFVFIKFYSFLLKKRKVRLSNLGPRLS